MAKVRFDLSVEEAMRQGIALAAREAGAGNGRGQSDWVRKVIADELDALYGGSWKSLKWEPLHDTE